MSTSTEEGTADRPVSVTEAAADQAIELMEQEGMDLSDSGVRLYVQQGGCAGLSYGMRFDREPDEDDLVLEQHSLRVFIDPASLEYINGSVFDYEGGLQAEGFHVENPNVVSECGCGESFRT